MLRGPFFTHLFRQHHPKSFQKQIFAFNICRCVPSTWKSLQRLFLSLEIELERRSRLGGGDWSNPHSLLPRMLKISRVSVLRRRRGAGIGGEARLGPQEICSVCALSVSPGVIADVGSEKRDVPAHAERARRERGTARAERCLSRSAGTTRLGCHCPCMEQELALPRRPNPGQHLQHGPRWEHRPGGAEPAKQGLFKLYFNGNRDIFLLF